MKPNEKDQDQEGQDRQGSSFAFGGVFSWQTNRLQVIATRGVKYASTYPRFFYPTVLQVH